VTFDAVTLAAVRDEVERHLLGGRVERVVLPADLAVGLEFYAHGVKRWLLASAHPQQARVHISSDRLARASDDVSPLLLLLRKYVRDGRLVSVDQPPWERVLSLSFEKRDDDGSPLACTLIIEIMGRHSNIVLVGEAGKVLDAAKRVTSAVSRQRTILPSEPYLPPPPQTKAPPAALAAEELRQLCAADDKPDAPFAQALVGAVAGISPLLAREVAFRATGSTTTSLRYVDWTRAAEGLREIVDAVVNRRWQPTLALEREQPVAFAAYELQQYSHRQPMESASALVEAFYARAGQPTRKGETGKAALREILEGVRERAQRRQRALKESLPRFEEVDRLRRWGEALFAFGYQAQRGDTALEVEGERIPLDPLLSAVDNAQAYFREYHKAKAGLEEVPRRLEEVEAELAFLSQVATDLDLASNPAEVEEVRQELRSAGFVREPEGGKRKQRDKALPLGRPVVSADGLEILIGRSARQNERVTFELGMGSDLWLHARGIPGAHVIVKARGREVPERTLREAAGYAAYFSQSRDDASVAVDFTLQRFVKRLKGGPPGLVNYTNERTMHVRPVPPPDGKLR
jgi:predicted ribosome quality control (RQC) complex YloA/Tae2 family protein